MRIAHLSDIHVLDLTGTPRRQLIFNKRVTGVVNLAGFRKDMHPQALLVAAVAQLATDESIDHVVISGDLTNLSLPSEFAKARALLAPLGGYDRLSVIPGNHDIYTRGSARDRRFESYFGRWMWPAGADGSGQVYPWFKDLDDVVLCGFNSAVPRLPIIASGVVSEAQLSAFSAGAQRLRIAERFTIAMVHHNLHPRGARKDAMHGLTNRDVLLDACAGAGVNMLLHGHTHKPNRFTHGGMEVVGCGSSTWAHPEHPGRYNVYTIEDGALKDVEIRVWNQDAQTFAAQQPRRA